MTKRSLSQQLRDTSWPSQLLAARCADRLDTLEAALQEIADGVDHAGGYQNHDEFYQAVRWAQRLAKAALEARQREALREIAEPIRDRGGTYNWHGIAHSRQDIARAALGSEASE